MNESYSYPTSLKKLRACLSCHLVKTEDQFLAAGCENCGEEWEKTEVLEKITSNFKGIIAITNPKFSWCAKWLHKSKKENKIIGGLNPGFYCIDIISDEQEDEEDNNQYEDEEADS